MEELLLVVLVGFLLELLFVAVAVEEASFLLFVEVVEGVVVEVVGQSLMVAEELLQKWVMKVQCHEMTSKQLERVANHLDDFVLPTSIRGLSEHDTDKTRYLPVRSDPTAFSNVFHFPWHDVFLSVHCENKPEPDSNAAHCFRVA